MRGDIVLLKSYSATELWSDVEYWVSENYLAKIVARIHPREASGLVYSASANGSACIRQAIAYEEAARSSDTSIRPLLLYYALLNWIKSFLHIMDLTYPSETTVLQHGVSVRRTKKASYQLPAEMVYIYKQGVLPSAADMVGLHLPQRIILGDILGLIPELHTLIAELYPKYQHLFPVFRGVPVEQELGGRGLGGRETKLRVFAPNEVLPTHSGSLFVSRFVASSNRQTVAEWVDDFLSVASGLSSQRQEHDTSSAEDSMDGVENGMDDTKVGIDGVANRIASTKVGTGAAQNNIDYTKVGTGPLGSKIRLGNDAADKKGGIPGEQMWTLESFMNGPSGYLRIPEMFSYHPWMVVPLENGSKSQKRTLPRRKENDTDSSNLDMGLLAARQPYPGWVNHFIVLYCLSALVRYNPLEWSDIVRWHNEQDALMVGAYLNHASYTIHESLRELLDDMLAAASLAETAKSGHEGD